MAYISFITPIENIGLITKHYDITSFTHDGITLFFESLTYDNSTFAANYATVDWTQLAIDSYKASAISKLRMLYGNVVASGGTVQSSNVILSPENALMLLVSQGAFQDITLPSIGENVTVNHLNAHSFTTDFLTLYFQRYAAYINTINAVYDCLTINAIDAAVANYEALIV